MKTKTLLITLIATCLFAFFTKKTKAQVLVKDFSSSGPGQLTDVNGTLFFAVYATSVVQLWKTDGTNAGSVLVKDFAGTSIAGLDYLTNVNGTLFFSTRYQGFPSNLQLWKSDGTASGTIMLKAFIPGGNAYLREFTAANNTLFFSASEQNTGEELWKSDGTPGGTLMVKDIYPGTTGSSPEWLESVNGTVYFQASDNGSLYGLYKSDGTAGGTVYVGCTGVCGDRAKELINANGTLYFNMWDSNNEREIWKSDGTAGGTYMIKDINPGYVNSITTYYGYLTNVNGIVYFKASDGVHGQELWKTNGTNAGTVMVKDICTTNSAGSVPMNLTNVNGTLFFTATDNTSTTFLWKTDGTDAGTTIVSNSVTFATGTYLDKAAVGNKLFYVGGGYELTKTDGTSAGTQVLATYAYPGPEKLTKANNLLYYLVETKLYKYDPFTGINSNSLNNNFQIYPNPSTGKFSIELQDNHQEMSLEIYNLLGEKVYTASYGNQQTSNEIDLSSSPKGIYFVKIYDAENSYSKKIVVQ